MTTKSFDDQNSDKKQKLPRNAGFWITLVRACLVIILGTVLIFQPEKTRPMLVNFMGFFWLTSGLVGLRWGFSDRHNRKFFLFAAVISVVAGLITVTRHLLGGFLSEPVAVYLLGAVMVLTGVMHVVHGFRGADGSRFRIWANIIGGIFEIVLGAMLLISPFSYGPIFYSAIIVWAFLGGIALFMQAWRGRH